MALEIRTAAELIALDVEGRGAARRAARETELLQCVLRAFVEQPEPVRIDLIATALPTRPRESVFAALAKLDEEVGIAPMLGRPVRIRSRCHHCGEPMDLSIDPSGPEPETGGVTVWVGKRPEDERRACDSL